MNRIICILLLCIGLHSSTSAQTEFDEAFNKANDLYQVAMYDSAIAIYNGIIDREMISAELHYNLGNAYYKKGVIADAILNYERAARLDPDDDDIKHNLARANANTVDKIDPAPMVFYEIWFQNLLHSSTVASKAKIAILILWIALLLWLTYLFAGSVVLRKSGFYLCILFLLCGSVVLGLTVFQNQKLETSDHAIVFTTSAYVKSSPEKSGANLFLLHEGTKVEITDELSEWKKIRIANGNVGWILGDALVII